LLSDISSRFSLCLFSYDVYTRLAELDLRDVGMETEWETVPVKMEDKEEVWRGVRREYWKLDEYRLPICQMSIF
jgi:protein arginine N-methyltransferase 2